MASLTIIPTDAEREALRLEAIFQLKNSQGEYASALNWEDHGIDTPTAAEGREYADKHRAIILASSELLGHLSDTRVRLHGEDRRPLRLSEETGAWLRDLRTMLADYMADIDNGEAVFKHACRAAFTLHSLDRLGFGEAA